MDDKDKELKEVEITVNDEPASVSDFVSMLIVDGWMSKDEDGNLAPIPDDTTN